MTDQPSIPTHIGMILDGNRRWARNKGLPTLEGHRAGYDNLRIIADAAFESGVKYLSAYIFSTENWNRTKEEVDYLMGLLPVVFRSYIKQFKKKGIRIVWLGETERLGKRELDVVNRAVEETKDGTAGTLALCFNYGGKQEIASAVRKIVESGVEASDVTPDLVANNLYCPDVPDVDLMIRTSGEQRISNFMLWRMAYAEMLFVDKHWPDFTPDDLQAAIAEFSRRNRRIGK